MALIDQLVQAVRDSAIVLTANQRLSRALRKIYDEHQLGSGQTAWTSPAILPLGSWLRARWWDALLAGAVRPSVMLTRGQEQIVWRRIIEQTPEGASLLDLRGTANSAMQAWRLIQQYRLPLDARFNAHEDWAAFAGWAADYRQLCADNNWLDEARLPDAVREAMAAGAIHRPARVVLAGFDEFTPQQKQVLGTLQWTQLEMDPVESNITRCACRDAGDELRACAMWARDVLLENPTRSVGIVLLNLGVGRGRLERVFDEALHPERMADPATRGARSYHISVPDPLAGYPLVSSALLALRMAPGKRWALSDAGILLRSPFLGGGVEEAAARATIDAKLRRWRRAYVTVTSIEALANATECPALSKIFEQWRALTTGLLDPRLPSEWLKVFRELLNAAAWPGDQVLSSAEYQVYESWEGLCRDFASLDATGGPLSYSSAIARLHELAEEEQFQPQDPGARVQIMGALEAAGAQFDALWITGATGETWPAPAHPHPFLPLSLQREHRLPHCSPEREYEFAARTFARLRSSAKEIIVSWAERMGDVRMRHSPLIEDLRTGSLASTIARPLPIELEQIVDETAPALENLRPRGGTRILKLQSACPFQAFADLRLGARPLEAADLGLSAADRGSAIHEALRFFWEAVRDHTTLVGLDHDDLRNTAERSVIAALRRPFRDSQHEFDKRLRELETQRLTQILVDWAEVEKSRAPFKAAFSERERTITIGGFEIEARMDRVDELPDGRHVILDYKATAPSVTAWIGERPDEPQLPLYAISDDAAVAAVAFAQVGQEGLRFKGYAADAAILPGVKTFPESGERQMQEWRRVLEPIAVSFRQGAAAADPRNGSATCEQCRLMSLCRIHETGPGAVEDPDAAP